jgi:hypothetical protein
LDTFEDVQDLDVLEKRFYFDQTHRRYRAVTYLGVLLGSGGLLSQDQPRLPKTAPYHCRNQNKPKNLHRSGQIRILCEGDLDRVGNDLMTVLNDPVTHLCRNREITHCLTSRLDSGGFHVGVFSAFRVLV